MSGEPVMVDNTGRTWPRITKDNAAQHPYPSLRHCKERGPGTAPYCWYLQISGEPTWDQEYGNFFFVARLSTTVSCTGQAASCDASAVSGMSSVVVAGLEHDAGSELAWLDAAAHPNRSLEAGHVLRLPLWCAGKLHDYGHVTLALPEMFSDGPRRDMDADASHLNLRECCDWYFETGRELAGRLNDESLLEMLSRGFVARFHKLLGAALSASSRVDTTAQKAKLTRVERALFDAGQHAKRSADAWRLARNAKLEASKFAAHRRKRKAGAGDI